MSNTLDVITADLQNYIVAPMNAFGVGGFVFDIMGEQISQLQADITDHYTEDNKAACCFASSPKDPIESFTSA